MDEQKIREIIRDEIITVYKITHSADYDSLMATTALGLAADKIYRLIDRSDSEGQVEDVVKKQNGVQFEAAYIHAMKVLGDYILLTRDKWVEAKSNESKEHYAMKEFFMRTAKKTFEENYKMYLEHPELFNK